MAHDPTEPRDPQKTIADAANLQQTVELPADQPPGSPTIADVQAGRIDATVDDVTVPPPEGSKGLVTIDDAAGREEITKTIDDADVPLPQGESGLADDILTTMD